jgi:putative transcription factor
MEHQDLKVVYLRKSNKEIEKKNVNNNHSVNVNKILDENLDEYKVHTVSHLLSTKIQKARVAQKLNQKELARKINVTVAVIQSYENGKAVPNNKVLQKLRGVLKVKLTL